MPDTQQPAKQSTFRLRRRTPGSFLLVPCPKQGRSIRCQGQLEAAAATILVSCPAVVTCRSSQCPSGISGVTMATSFGSTCWRTTKDFVPGMKRTAVARTLSRTSWSTCSTANRGFWKSNPPIVSIEQRFLENSSRCDFLPSDRHLEEGTATITWTQKEWKKPDQIVQQDEIIFSQGDDHRNRFVVKRAGEELLRVK